MRTIPSTFTCTILAILTMRAPLARCGVAPEGLHHYLPRCAERGTAQPLYPPCEPFTFSTTHPTTLLVLNLLRPYAHQVLAAIALRNQPTIIDANKARNPKPTPTPTPTPTPPPTPTPTPTLTLPLTPTRRDRTARLLRACAPRTPQDLARGSHPARGPLWRHRCDRSERRLQRHRAPDGSLLRQAGEWVRVRVRVRDRVSLLRQAGASSRIAYC